MGKEEVIDAEIVEEITSPNLDDVDVCAHVGRDKQPRGTRKRDFPKFNPKTRETILALVAEGSPDNHAANIAGITVATLYRWLERGRTSQRYLDEGDEVDPIDTDFAEFFTNYNKLFSAPRIQLLRSIMKAAKGDPGDPEKGIPPTKPNHNLALKMLEKLDPEQFGQRQAIDMQVKGKVGVGHIHVDARQLEGGTDEILGRITTEDLRLLRAAKQKEKQQKALPAGDEEDDE